MVPIRREKGKCKSLITTPSTSSPVFLSFLKMKRKTNKTTVCTTSSLSFQQSSVIRASLCIHYRRGDSVSSHTSYVNIRCYNTRRGCNNAFTRGMVWVGRGSIIKTQLFGRVCLTARTRTMQHFEVTSHWASHKNNHILLYNKSNIRKVLH